MMTASIFVCCTKHLFHSRANIVDQLFFNIDVQQTLQLLHPVLQQESADKSFLHRLP